MQNQTIFRFTPLYILIVLFELFTAQNESYHHLHYYAKPLIVLSLFLFFVSHAKHLKTVIKITVSLALLFSLTGDVLLMFVNVSENYFLAGLASFLLAHIMYCIAFLKQRNKKVNPLYFIILLLIYASGLNYLIFPGLNDFTIPVFVYMAVIMTMAVLAYTRLGAVTKFSYAWVLLGALFFLVSDSFLAINKFYEPLKHGNLLIMNTYALAQYLIVFGILDLKSRRDK
ncbi:MAG: lysoplasmalogenase [Bacteroidetes bacterium MedPE-SWsnd-G2]|nr:MAG: lysoplasmalogenase [Bacteroidetes bacterium MedPE-SWsnd-G2]